MFHPRQFQSCPSLLSHYSSFQIFIIHHLSFSFIAHNGAKKKKKRPLQVSVYIECCCIRADLTDDSDGGFKNSPGCPPLPPHYSQHATVSVSHLLCWDHCITISAQAEDQRFSPAYGFWKRVVKDTEGQLSKRDQMPVSFGQIQLCAITGCIMSTKAA